MTPQEKDALATIEQVIAENAALLGEPVKLGVRRVGGAVRIQVCVDGKWARGEYAEYPNLVIALKAARESNRRAQIVNAKVKAGMRVAAAVRDTPLDPDWRVR